MVSFREELLEVREEAEKKISELEGRGQNLQKVIQQVSEDFQKVSPLTHRFFLEKSFHSIEVVHICNDRI